MFQRSDFDGGATLGRMRYRPVRRALAHEVSARRAAPRAAFTEITAKSLARSAVTGSPCPILSACVPFRGGQLAIDFLERLAPGFQPEEIIDQSRQLAAGRMASRPGLWLTRRPGRGGSVRYFFQPSRFDRNHGWKTVRLHDRNELPIKDESKAIAACSKLAEIYLAWKQGRAGFWPHLIDVLGRPVGKPNPLADHVTAGEPGTIAAIAADFLESDEYGDLKPSTQDDYRLCIDALVKEFGPRQWDTISAREAKAWIRAKAARHPSMAHQWYRTCRALLNYTRLVYDRDHPGYVPAGLNPFDKLKLRLPKARPLVWPSEAVSAAVALADELGRPSLGDAIVTMAWVYAGRIGLPGRRTSSTRVFWAGIQKRPMPRSQFPGR